MARYNLEKRYKFEFWQKADYCTAKITGDLSNLDVARQYWAEIVQEATKCQPKRLLIWEESEESLSTTDTFLLVKELCQLTQFQQLRIAFLDEHTNHLDRNKLGEMIATNSGFTCRVFTDFGEAEKWLLAGYRA